jgi:hypothetical protein
MYVHTHLKCPLISLDFNETWILLAELWKIIEYQTLLKSIQCKKGYAMQMDKHDKASSRFSEVCKHA